MPHRETASPRATVLEVSAQYPVLEASPNAVIAVDVHGSMTYANSAAFRTFGYRPGELVGRPVETLLPEMASVRHVAKRDRLLAHPVARPMGAGLDLAGRRKDGSIFPAEIGLSPVGTGKDLLVFATIVDISGRKAVEAAHAESERRFRAVLEWSPNPVLAIDTSGAITYANRQVSVTFGYAADEVLGRPIELLLPYRVAQQHVSHREGFLAHPVARPMGIGLDLAGRRKDGREFPVEISLSPVETADGLQIFATVVDISVRKSAEAALLQAQKLESIGRLAGGIAHDFNNMLFAIRGYAELLAEDLVPENAGALDLEESQQSIKAISEAADRAANLTGQLLAFSRQQPIVPKVLDLNQAVHGLEPMLRRLVGENVKLILRLDDNAGRVRGDAGQLDQILVNLVVNARDAMPDGGTVTIDTGNAEFDEPYVAQHFDVTPGPYVLLAVSDTGMGIDRETREHIFEPFFTTKELGKGTGLGLATIYGIVKQSGGHIWLYSEVGLGTSFKIYFPRVDAEAIAKRPPAVGGPIIGAGKVLVVEDEPLVRAMTTRVLTRAGYDVIALADGTEAIARLDELGDSLDVLVSDVIMPNMSGLDVAEQMMDRYPRVGVVLLSGYTAETLNLDRVTARGATFVSKPVVSAQLLTAVQQAPAWRWAHPPARPSRE